MIKKLIALAFAAAFGIAHAADTTQSTPPTGKGVGADSAIGNVPQTTEPVGTNAPSKTATKTSKKHHKASHKKSSKSDTGAAAGSTDTTK